MSSSNGDRERYQRYLCSREWGVKKEAVRKRCFGFCERCLYFKMSHVHHLTYARKYNELLEDLQGLCEGCHEFVHAKRDRDPVLDVPWFVQGCPVRRVYFAGKFTEPDWRGDIAKGIAYRNLIRTEGIGWDHRSFPFLLPDGKELTYVGPFRADIGHGENLGPHRFCWEGPFDDSGHGIGQVRMITDASIVISQCAYCITNCDLVFAWVDTRECYGTLIEIGFAVGVGKKVVVASPSFDRELWLGLNIASRFIQASSAEKAWDALVRTPGVQSPLIHPEDEEELEGEQEEEEVSCS